MTAKTTAMPPIDTTGDDLLLAGRILRRFRDALNDGKLSLEWQRWIAQSLLASVQAEESIDEQR